MTMKYVKHLDQRHDGGFDCYVVFGDIAPWDAPDEVCVKCATEQDADKLIALLAHNVELSGCAPEPAKTAPASQRRAWNEVLCND